MQRIVITEEWHDFTFQSKYNNVNCETSISESTREELSHPTKLLGFKPGLLKNHRSVYLYIFLMGVHQNAPHSLIYVSTKTEMSQF